jgi:hypothetical protein
LVSRTNVAGGSNTVSDNKDNEKDDNEGILVCSLLDENERFFLRAENVTKSDVGGKDPRKRK